MITLTKKYRLIWEALTLNIQNDYERDNTGSTTMLTDSLNYMGYYESDNYQDIENRINEDGLRPPEEWLSPGDEDI